MLLQLKTVFSVFCVFITLILIGSCQAVVKETDKASIEKGNSQDTVSVEIDHHNLISDSLIGIPNGKVVGQNDASIILKNGILISSNYLILNGDSINTVVNLIENNNSSTVFSTSSLLEYDYTGTEGEVITVSNEDEQLFALFSDGNLVVGIAVQAEVFQTKEGLRVNSRLKEVIENYPDIEFQINAITGYETCSIPNGNIQLIFKTVKDSRIGVYEYDQPDILSKAVNIDNFKVDEIIIRNN